MYSFRLNIVWSVPIHCALRTRRSIACFLARTYAARAPLLPRALGYQHNKHTRTHCTHSFLVCISHFVSIISYYIFVGLLPPFYPARPKESVLHIFLYLCLRSKRPEYNFLSFTLLLCIQPKALIAATQKEINNNNDTHKNGPCNSNRASVKYSRLTIIDNIGETGRKRVCTKCARTCVCVCVFRCAAVSVMGRLQFMAKSYAIMHVLYRRREKLSGTA